MAGTDLLILLDVSIQICAWILMLVAGLSHWLILMSLNFSVYAMADTKDAAYTAAIYTFTCEFSMCIGVALEEMAFQDDLGTALVICICPRRFPTMQKVSLLA